MKYAMMMGLLALGVGCAGDGPVPPAGQDEVTVDEVGEVPAVDGEGSGIGAGIRRMTLRELDASIRIAAGPDADGEEMFWNAIAGVPINAIDTRAYGEILGEPDWVSVTEEADAPSPLYTKFVQDMSRDVCIQMVAADVARPSGDDMTLFRHAPIDAAPSADELDSNLRYLLLRFLGLEGPEADERCDALATLHEDVTTIATGDGDSEPWVRGWAVVCYALFEDPAFHLH